jgi:choline dehydrogenase-like flavoprotein
MPAKRGTATMPESAETVIVGGGLGGLLIARELVRAGQSVTLVERGAARLDADGLPHADREEKLATSEHNIDSVPAKGGHRWQYAYALGGSSLLWSGVAPRLLPSDFEMHSRYGVFRDWPIAYSDLVPFYKLAEQALEVSGRPSEIFPESDAYPEAPPPPSSVDRLLGPLLEPFGVLPTARHRTGDANQPGADGETNWTALGLARELAAAPGFRLVGATAARRLRVDSGRVAGVECVEASGEQVEIRAKRVVLATNGIENPALLLRSGLEGPAVGRWLGDHTHAIFEIELDRDVEHLSSTRDGGVGYAWTDGPWRAERSAAIVIPYNPGLSVRTHLAEALGKGEHGAGLRHRLARRFARTVVVYASVEDPPREDRFVELSPQKDGLGMPRTRVHYPPDSDYVQRGLEVLESELLERLAPLGAKVVGRGAGGLGGHMLGTCFMGDGGVVDSNLRHHEIDNLYVSGGSAFPTHSPMHPTTTIAALSIRLGQHLTEETA